MTPSQVSPEGCRRPGPPSHSSLSCHPTAGASPAGLLQPQHRCSSCKGSLRARSTRVRLREHISARSLLGGDRRARGIWGFCLEHARFNCLGYQLLMHSCGRALACSLFAQRCGNVMQLWYCCDENSCSEAPGGKPCPSPSCPHAVTDANGAATPLPPLQPSHVGHPLGPAGFCTSGCSSAPEGVILSSEASLSACRHRTCFWCWHCPKLPAEEELGAPGCCPRDLAGEPGVQPPHPV